MGKENCGYPRVRDARDQQFVLFFPLSIKSLPLEQWQMKIKEFFP